MGQALQKAVKHEIIIDKEIITPQRAAEFLATSRTNRQISDYTVLAYSIQMAEGRWGPYPGIDFDFNGHLLNGHHRMHSVIASGIDVEMFVTRGLDPSDQEIMDTGRPRSLPQQLRMYRKELKNTTSLAAYVTLGAFLLSNTRVKVLNVREWEKWYTILAPGVKWAEKELMPDRLCKAAAVGGSLAFAYATNPDGIQKFGEKLVLGEKLKRGDPALVLRNKIVRTHPGEKVGVFRDTLARYVLNAAMASLSNEKVDKLNSSDAGRAYFHEAYERMRRVKAAVAPWQPNLRLVEEGKAVAS